MHSETPAVDAQDSDTLAIAFVLLLLQAAFGFLSALGLLVVVVASHSLALMAGPALLAIVVPAAVLLFAAGIARGRRWAWFGALGFEGLTLLGAGVGAGVHVLASRESISLVALVTTVVLPLSVAGLLRSKSAREILRRSSAIRRESIRCKRTVSFPGGQLRPDLHRSPGSS